ncbi:MAG: hypothetical protein Q4D57_05680 [Clostridia bacterium]|nr:hypothetical protein [Clostridia bacterium]
MFKKLKFNVKKSFSVLLSLIMIANSFGTCLGVCARKSQNQVSISEKINALVKASVVAVGATVVVGGSIIAAEACGPVGSNAAESSYWKNVDVAEDYGRFVVDKRFADEIPNQFRSRIVKKVKDIFEAYPNITHSFDDICKKSKISKKFCIKLDDFSKSYYNNHKKAVAVCCFPFGISLNQDVYHNFAADNAAKSSVGNDDVFIQIFMSNYKNYREWLYLERMAAHEMGHLIQHTLAIRELGFRTVGDYVSLDNIKRAEKMYAKIKKEVIKIARERFGYMGDGFITKYGETSDSEWFAEVCADCFASKHPTALGKAMGEFLKLKNQELQWAFK